jgi:hypothetical protein
VRTPERPGSLRSISTTSGQIEHELDRLLCVGGLADELEPATDQELAQRGADQPLVVDQHDRDRPAALSDGVLLV